jgi:hypothetical protein
MGPSLISIRLQLLPSQLSKSTFDGNTFKGCAEVEANCLIQDNSHALNAIFFSGTYQFDCGLLLLVKYCSDIRGTGNSTDGYSR